MRTLFNYNLELIRIGAVMKTDFGLFVWIIHRLNTIVGLRKADFLPT